MKKPTPSPTQTHMPPGYWPGTTLGGQAWRGQLRREFYQCYSQLYQLGTGGHTQKDLACMRCLPEAIGASEAP